MYIIAKEAVNGKGKHMGSRKFLTSDRNVHNSFINGNRIHGILFHNKERTVGK